MDSVLFRPIIPNNGKSEFGDNCAIRKSGKDLLNQQRSPLMVYERAAVFLQQLKPRRNNSTSDGGTYNPQLEKSVKYNKADDNVREKQDRVNALIMKHEVAQKANETCLNSNSYSPVGPPSNSSCNENCSLVEYPMRYDSMGKFRKTPSSISIHSQKVTHYEMHECPIVGNIYGCKGKDPLYHIYGNKFSTPMLTSSTFNSGPQYLALPSDISLQTKSSGLRLRSGSENTVEPESCLEVESFAKTSLKEPPTRNWSDVEYRILALFSTLVIFTMGKILTVSFKYMDNFKRVSDRFLIKCWIQWGLSSIVRKDKTNNLNIIVFGPIMAVMGTLYSIFWLAYTFVRLLLSPTPQRFVSKFNFESFFGKAC
ncbi:unnamed protein product [Hermetia illucens]|uniref:Uncharacterized protein n=1 Tax=Hermetia illucens TaxID=343691 RepID=A0A7R8UQL9_HERIL|nr:unnamed protein product [Hermetia illucens]